MGYNTMHIIRQDDGEKLDFEGDVDMYGVLDLTIRDKSNIAFTLTVNKAEAKRLVHLIESLYQEEGL